MTVLYSLNDVEYYPAVQDGAIAFVKAAKKTLNDGDKRQDAQGRTWVFNGQTRRWKIHREEGVAPKGKSKSKAKEVMPTIASESGDTPTQSAAAAKSKTKAKKPKESTPKVSRGKSYTSASGNRFQRFQIEHNGRTETVDIKTRDGRNGPELMSYAEAKAQALKQFQESGKPAQDSGSGEKANEGSDRPSTPTTTKSRSKKPKAEAATGGDRPSTQKKTTTPKSTQSEQPLADGFTVVPTKTAETPSTLKPKSQSTTTAKPKETRAQSLQRQIDHLKAVKAPMSEARQKTIAALEEQLKAEGGGQRSKTKNKKSVSTIPPATKKKSEKQEFNTQSPEISAKDLLSEPNMFEARTVNLPPDIKDALERGDYGSAANKYILEAEGMRFSKSEAADATRYAKDIAARINQVRNPSQLRGANLYGAEKFRNGPKITSQQKFDRLYDEVTRTMSDGGAGELLPIYKIRRAMGDRVSRAEFDEFLYKTTQRRSHRLVESGVEDNAKDKFLDSVVTNLGHLRTYISTQT